ncbi:MAG TPA: VOC family protein [Myxococcales bacterium]|jgi:predicted enzyme related to lactoylglutathione lyase|nr:VOC family protein [Myxococcales bacterium]
MPAPVAYFELHTPDASRARAFYGELFNWSFKDAGAPSPYFEVQSGGDVPGGLMADTASPPMMLTYFHVPDLDRAVARVKALGGKVLKEREDIPPGSFAVIADPQGVVLALWQKAASK